MLALAFLLLIGVSLVADGLGFHIPRGYIYSAMAFSAMVEVINIIARRRRSPVAQKPPAELEPRLPGPAGLCGPRANFLCISGKRQYLSAKPIVCAGFLLRSLVKCREFSNGR